MTLEQEVALYRNLVARYRFCCLTGMKQRHDFEVETASKMERQVFWLAMVDVTGLHQVNRSQGYAAGDELIRQVADEIKQTEGLWEVYRIGGDEFMAVYFDTPSKVCGIGEATCAWVHSSWYSNLDEMVKAVDELVTNKKKALGRRRAD